MQVGVDVKCMHTNFGVRSLSSFGDIDTPKNGHGLSVLADPPYQTMDYGPLFGRIKWTKLMQQNI